MKKVTIITIILLMFLIGCASVGHKLDQEAVSKIKKGETTKKEVLALIGSPDQIVNLGNGDTSWSYTYVRATAKPATFIPIVGPFVGGTNVQNQFLTITFDPDNVVKNIMGTYGATEMDQGLTTGSKPDIKDVEENKRPK
jgi:outer membrane protein assembly factor BamE (lipoprotein component of BamABCDE complex)